MNQRGFVGVEIFYRNMPLRTPNHSFEICGGPKALTSTTICKKCGGPKALTSTTVLRYVVVPRP